MDCEAVQRGRFHGGGARAPNAGGAHPV